MGLKTTVKGWLKHMCIANAECLQVIARYSNLETTDNLGERRGGSGLVDQMIDACGYLIYPGLLYLEVPDNLLISFVSRL